MKTWDEYPEIEDRGYFKVDYSYTPHSLTSTKARIHQNQKHNYLMDYVVSGSFNDTSFI